MADKTLIRQISNQIEKQTSKQGVYVSSIGRDLEDEKLPERIDLNRGHWNKKAKGKPPRLLVWVPTQEPVQAIFPDNELRRRGGYVNSGTGDRENKIGFLLLRILPLLQSHSGDFHLAPQLEALLWLALSAPVPQGSSSQNVYLNLHTNTVTFSASKRTPRDIDRKILEQGIIGVQPNTYQAPDPTGDLGTIEYQKAVQAYANLCDRWTKGHF